MARRAFTLVELIISVVMLGVISAVIFSLPIFFIGYVNADLERYNIYSQINYALEDMKLRCASAIQVAQGSFFASASTTGKPEFEFDGESDIYNITPDDLSDNARYKYFIDENKDLVLQRIFNGLTTKEILVENKYRPQIEFKYTSGDEPNFLTVTVQATNDKSTAGISKTISKSEGLRFWFVDIIR